MIQSKSDYKSYLIQDRISTGLPERLTIKAKIKDLFFPNYEWKFIKTLRWLEFCENVIKSRPGGG